MIDPRIVFSILWVALMLIYLLGDVVRIFAGDFKAGEMDEEGTKPYMWTIAAAIMVIPIIMVVLNILLPSSSMKWPNIIVSIAFFLFNLMGLKGYKFYDQMLLVISFVLNALMVYLAFTIY